MSGETCVVEHLDIFGAICKCLADIALFTITGFAIYFLIFNKSFRNTPANVIISSMLISHTLNGLIADGLRAYINFCHLRSFVLCTVVVVSNRTFGYISMANLVFISIERYLKLTKSPRKYELAMNMRMQIIIQVGIWTLFTVFSIVTTPNWYALIAMGNILLPLGTSCTYAAVMAPIILIITLTLSQILPVILLVTVNVILSIKVGRIISQREETLNLSEEQKEINQVIKRKIEMKLYIMIFILTLFNLGIFILTSIDIILSITELMRINLFVPSSLIKYLVTYVTLYPCFVSVTCFIFCAEFKDLTIALIKKPFLKK